MGRTCPCGVPELDIILKSLTEQRLYSFHQKQDAWSWGAGPLTCSFPRTLVLKKKPSVMVNICSPSTGGADTGGTPGADWLAHLA